MARYLKPDNPDECISCNICLTACPVAKATQKYRGPKLTGPALSRLRMLIEDEDPMLQYCSNCKNCDRVCPSGAPISSLNMKARGAYYKRHQHSMAEIILSNNEQLGRTITSIPLAPLAANLGMKISCSLKMMELVGIDSDAPLPRYADRNLYSMYKSYRQPECEKKVLFFPGCYVNYYGPEVGMALIKVLNRNNIGVVLDSEFCCCGSPMISAGYLEKVENNARKNVAILAKYADQGMDIITTCTTCGLFLKQEYEEIFRLDEIKRYNSHMYDSMEYLLMLHEKGQLDTSFKEVDKGVIYHTPCHLKVQGLGRPTLRVLRLIPSLRVEDADAGCCGLSGIYGYKKNTSDISRTIGQRLRDRVRDSAAGEGVCECNICRLQMENGTQKRARHPLTLLAEAYGV